MKKYIFWIIVLSITGANTAIARDQLSATIIGSGSPKYSESRASASVLVTAGNTKVLVDMGNGTQANLHKMGMDSRQVSAMFFTHHHLDHNEEFVPMLIHSLLGRQSFEIIGPPNTVKLTEANLALYAEDIAYRLGKSRRTFSDREKDFKVRDIRGGETFDIGAIRVSTLKVPHTIHTIAYRFDYKGESIVVTGDLTYSEVLPGFAKNADYMIIDSGGMIMKNSRGDQKGRKGSRKGMNVAGQGSDNRDLKRKRERAHLNLKESGMLAKQANVKNLVYTHFMSGEVDQVASLKEIRKNYSGNVIFGKDLMVIGRSADKPLSGSSVSSKTLGNYPIVDTGQVMHYSDSGKIRKPVQGDVFYGQDATYTGNRQSYADNKNGTVTDNVTGLMWQQEMGEKMTYSEAMKRTRTFNLAGHRDWRIPSVKELYSLISFNGQVQGAKVIKPFIDTRYFKQPLGNTRLGEREIDAQTWSSTQYVGRTMRNDESVFGVNFTDGRIKGYPKFDPRTRKAKKMYFRFVRGNNAYGKNNFVDNGNGTVTDYATGLVWQQSDSGKGFSWKDALEYAENMKLVGHDDWRLPNAKELQSIVDYTRSVQTTRSAAINPLFITTQIIDPQGKKQYPYFWTGTTHLDGRNPYASAVYIAFGEAQGKMRGRLMDVHGAGAQRSDPKSWKQEQLPRYFGPQGDLRYVFNYVRCVRSIKP